jgi:hypothetical protein
VALSGRGMMLPCGVGKPGFGTWAGEAPGRLVCGAAELMATGGRAKSRAGKALTPGVCPGGGTSAAGSSYLRFRPTRRKQQRGSKSQSPLGCTVESGGAPRRRVSPGDTLLEELRPMVAEAPGTAGVPVPLAVAPVVVAPLPLIITLAPTAEPIVGG